MEVYILGIDIAKKKFDLALLVGDRPRHQTFANDPQGFAALADWLEQHKVAALHACMEATGRYWQALADFLHQSGHTVSVVNPACVKAFGRSQLKRTKTDRADAALIAQFCRATHPKAWTPLDPALRQLQELGRHLADIKAICADTKNRLSSAPDDPVIKGSLQTLLAHLNQQVASIMHHIRDHLNSHPELKAQRDLLISIPGIGKITAIFMLCEAGDIRNYASARQLAAHSGLTPKHRQSGTSILGRPHLSKIGNANLRKALYWPAISATKHNPIIRAFFARLIAAGKPTMLAIAAAMRKLIHIIFGVLKHQQPFNPNLCPCLS